MLSILIPCYNYNVFPLVLELQKQCETCGIEYEIIVLDDASTVEFHENKKIINTKNCIFLKNKQNFGRAFTINKLIESATFQYVLILEADAFPAGENYIQIYVNSLKQKPPAVFGGVIYPTIQPAKNKVLRWIYGNARESKKLDFRLQNPYDIVFSWNLLLDKNVLLKPVFDSSIKTYGYEDLVFLKNLKENNIIIQQIENFLIHTNEEESAIFIEKSKIAVNNLIELYQKENLSGKDLRLLKTFEIVNKLKAGRIIYRSFQYFEKFLNKNLQSGKPCLFLFDLYRLGYFCQQIELKNRTK